jgi:hypothetical protein
MVQVRAKRGSRVNGYATINIDRRLKEEAMDYAEAQNKPLVTVMEEAMREYLFTRRLRKPQNTTV